MTATDNAAEPPKPIARGTCGNTWIIIWRSRSPNRSKIKLRQAWIEWLPTPGPGRTDLTLPLSLHLISDAPAFQAALFGLAVLAGVALLVGWKTRLATIVAWFLTSIFDHLAQVVRDLEVGLQRTIRQPEVVLITPQEIKRVVDPFDEHEAVAAGNSQHVDDDRRRHWL